MYSVDDVKAKIAQLQAVGMQFERNMARLLELETAAKLTPEAWSNWNAIMSRGASVKDAIAKGVSYIQDAVQWIKDTTGMTVSGLGFGAVAIVLAVGAIVAAITLGVAWNNDANSEIRKLEILRATVASLPAEQQAKILADATTRTRSTVFGDLSKTAMLVMLAVAGVFVLPKLLRR